MNNSFLKLRTLEISEYNGSTSDVRNHILYSIRQLYFALSSELFAIKLAVANILNFKEPCLNCTDSLNSLRYLTKYPDYTQHPFAKVRNISYSITFVLVVGYQVTKK